MDEVNTMKDKAEYLEDYNKNLLGNIPISVLVIDSENRVIFANKNFFQKTRKTKEEVLYANINAVFPPAFIKGMGLQAKLRNVINRKTTEEGSVAYRIKIYNYRMLSIEDEEGKTQALLILDDVTEERELEERIKEIERHLTEVVESASDLVFSANPRGKILTWNKAAEEITGYNIEDLEGKSFASLFPTSARKQIRGMFRELKKGKVISTIELNLKTSEGKQAPISWGFGVIRSDKGKVIGLMGVGRDLTERKEMEVRLLQSEKMASLGRLSAGIAHEINNPLGVIGICTENLLQKEKHDEFKIRNIKRIQAQVDRAAGIVENLLNFSRPTKPDIKPIKAEEVLEDTLALIEHQLKLDNIEIVREFSPGLPKIMGDSSQLQQVFINMIQNAQQAMPDGGKLYIVTKYVEDDKNFIWVIFSDTGKGISPKDLPSIFDLFYTTREVGGGVGLGLSLSYSIIQKHKGEIKVTSEVGRGTTFFIKLPVSHGG